MRNISIEDIRKNKYTNQVTIDNGEIYREFIKKDKVFIGTDHFFLSDDVDNNLIFTKIHGYNNEKCIKNINNKFILFYNTEYSETEIIKKNKNINLMLIHDYEFEMDMNQINVKKLIHENKLNNHESNLFLKEIYFNNNCPKFLGNNEINKNNEIKKYLFKIKKNKNINKQNIEQMINI